MNYKSAANAIQNVDIMPAELQELSGSKRTAPPKMLNIGIRRLQLDSKMQFN